MADKEYGSVAGVVQQFKEQPVVTQRDTSAGVVHDFVIRSIATQGLVSVGAFDSDYPDFDVEAGSFVSIDGPFTTNEKNGTTYVNFTARKLAVLAPLAKTERETTNKGKGRAKNADPQF